MDAPGGDINSVGDTLAVGFPTSYVLDGYPLRETVGRGQIAARYTCTLNHERPSHRTHAVGSLRRADPKQIVSQELSTGQLRTLISRLSKRSRYTIR